MGAHILGHTFPENSGYKVDILLAIIAVFTLGHTSPENSGYKSKNLAVAIIAVFTLCHTSPENSGYKVNILLLPSWLFSLWATLHLKTLATTQISFCITIHNVVMLLRKLKRKSKKIFFLEECNFFWGCVEKKSSK